MAVLQMQRVSICALKKERKAILEKLQSIELMEMDQILADDEAFQKMDTLSDRQKFDKCAQAADQALDVLDLYAPQKKSLLAMLEGKKLIEKDRFEQTVSRKEAVLDKAKALVALNREIAENKAAIQKIETQIDTLKPWMPLDVPMNMSGTGKTEMLLGTMAPETTLESLLGLIAEQAPEVDAVDAQIISTDKDAAYVTVICLKSDRDQVESALRSGGFARPSQPVDKIPAEAKKDLEAQIDKWNARIDEIIEEIKKNADIREDLQLMGDYYRGRAGKYEVLGELPQSQRTFVVSGYVAKRDVPVLEKIIGEKFDCVIDVEDIKEEEIPPTVLSNNKFSASYEGVVEAYGLPHKGEFDPTTIMSFFYVFFFGMMLSDAAYGAIIAIACFVALAKFPRMDGGLRKTVRMFMYCGISTVIWGVLFGGYFGNAVDIISQTFMGKTVKIAPLWFEPLTNPMKLLVYSMAFGVVHLFTGLGIKGYILLKEGRKLDFFCDVVLWFVFLIGLLMLLIPSSLFASIAQVKIVFPPILNTIAKVFSIGGAVGLILMSGRANKNPALRIALGAYDVYGITSWLSDVLSYSRLLALGLATGVIASVVNQMGSMFGKGIIGIIGFALVFVVGHVLNLGINLLGAYVHTNRLQFVEFFGKFYDGGGRAFKPFKSDTKYVDIKEEM